MGSGMRLLRLFNSLYTVGPVRAARVSKRVHSTGVKQLAIGTLPDGRGSESAGQRVTLPVKAIRMSLLPYLERVIARGDLSSDAAREAMLSILGGDASTAQIAAFLVALRMKGETAGELEGFARAMREKATRVDPGLNGAPLLDTCGTGGAVAKAFNISTVAAFVVA